MKTWPSIFLVLVVAAAAPATTVTLVPIEEGEPGSASNRLQPSDEIFVLVTTDGGLIGLDCVLTITSGPAVIVNGCVAFCCCGEVWGCVPEPWPPPFCYDPVVPGKSVEIAGGNFGSWPLGVVGCFVLHCEGTGQVSVELSPGIAFGGSMDMNYMVPDIFGILEIHVAGPTCWDETECGGQPIGDASCDGNIGLADLYGLKAAFGRSAPWVDPECCSDYNQDGYVNLADLFILKANYGTTGLSPATGNQNCP